MKIQIYLPVFPGFYSTIFEPCNEDTEIECIDEERAKKGLEPVKFEDVRFNYNEYFKNVAEECTEAIERELQDEIHESIAVEFEELISPKEYNFRNDSINIAVNLSKEAKNKILEMLEENKEAFRLHIKEQYTSRSGFISSHSNQSSEWVETLKNGKPEDLNHKLGAILEFLLQEIIEYDQHSLYDAIETHTVYASNFDELTKQD